MAKVHDFIGRLVRFALRTVPVAEEQKRVGNKTLWRLLIPFPQLR
jgi:hypothetical protein